MLNEAREDFEREVEIMSAFDHDNILKLLGIVSESKYSCKVLKERSNLCVPLTMIIYSNY